MQKPLKTTSGCEEKESRTIHANHGVVGGYLIQPAVFHDQLYNISHLQQRRSSLNLDAHPLRASHTSSKKWSSDTALWSKKWERTQRGLRRLFPRSELLDWSYQDYLRHISEIASADAESARMAMERAISRSSALGALIPVLPPLQGRKPFDRYAVVLPVETVWRPDFGCDEILWPTYEDMKYEGDGRMEGEGFGRRLALPRITSNGTVSFKLIPRARPLPFDDFEVPPSDEDDIYLIYDEPLDEEANLFVGRDLLRALECNESSPSH